MHVSMATSSMSARWATVSRTSQYLAGVGRNQSSGTTSRSSACKLICSFASASRSCPTPAVSCVIQVRRRPFADAGLRRENRTGVSAGWGAGGGFERARCSRYATTCP